MSNTVNEVIGTVAGNLPAIADTTEKVVEAITPTATVADRLAALEAFSATLASMWASFHPSHNLPNPIAPAPVASE